MIKFELKKEVKIFKNIITWEERQFLWFLRTFEFLYVQRRKPHSQSLIWFSLIFLAYNALKKGLILWSSLEFSQFKSFIKIFNLWFFSRWKDKVQVKFYWGCVMAILIDFFIIIASGGPKITKSNLFLPKTFCDEKLFR